MNCQRRVGTSGDYYSNTLKQMDDYCTKAISILATIKLDTTNLQSLAGSATQDSVLKTGQIQADLKQANQSLADLAAQHHDEIKKYQDNVHKLYDGFEGLVQKCSQQCPKPTATNNVSTNGAAFTYSANGLDSTGKYQSDYRASDLTHLQDLQGCDDAIFDEIVGTLEADQLYFKNVADSAGAAANQNASQDLRCPEGGCVNGPGGEPPQPKPPCDEGYEPDSTGAGCQPIAAGEVTDKPPQPNPPCGEGFETDSTGAGCKPVAPPAEQKAPDAPKDKTDGGSTQLPPDTKKDDSALGLGIFGGLIAGGLLGGFIGYHIGHDTGTGTSTSTSTDTSTSSDTSKSTTGACASSLSLSAAITVNGVKQQASSINIPAGTAFNIVGTVYVAANANGQSASGADRQRVTITCTSTSNSNACGSSPLSATATVSGSTVTFSNIQFPSDARGTATLYLDGCPKLSRTQLNSVNVTPRQ